MRDSEEIRTAKQSLEAGDGHTFVDEQIDDAEQECALFQAQMPERISQGEDLQQNGHMKTCDRCRALVSDLEAIAKVAHELFPSAEAEPREDLWTKIELAIVKGEA